MEEKTTNEKETSELPAGDTGTGDKPQKFTAIDDANTAAKRMEDANKVKAELLAREERLEAGKRLGGRSEAGQEPTKPTLTDAEKASRDRIKAVGLAGGATWAKNMDKEDNAN